MQKVRIIIDGKLVYSGVVQQVKIEGEKPILSGMIFDYPVPSASMVILSNGEASLF